MKFGFFHLMQALDGEDEREIIKRDLELVRMAEDMGFHSVFLAEHHFSPYCVDSAIAVQAGYLAGKTSRIKVGTAVVVLPHHHPLRLAEDWAMVDVLSEGRLEMGVGRGYNPFEFAGFGRRVDESMARFEEALDILERAWRGEYFSYDGKFYRIDNVRVLPRPIQQPHPRWFYASVSPASVTMAAQRRMGILSMAGIAPANLNERRATFIAAAREAGHSDARILDMLNNSPIERNVWVGREQAATEREAQQLYKAHASSFADWAIPGNKYPKGLLSDDIGIRPSTPTGQWDLALQRERRSAFVGTPERVRDEMEAFLAEHSTPYLLVQMTRGVGNRDALERCLRLFGEKVLPHFVGRPQLRSLGEAVPGTNKTDEWIERLRRAQHEVATFVHPGETFILVDEASWGGQVFADRRNLPFVEREGHYWGPPPDDETALREFERLRQLGASFIVFAWPAFWWLDHYAGLRQHLRGAFPCVRENDRLIAFDLRTEGGVGGEKRGSND